MTTALHNHIHLFVYDVNNSALDAGEQAACAYRVLTPGMDVQLENAVTIERGLTGVAHVYRTLDGSNNPKMFINGTLQLLVTTAQKDALLALSGKVCWLMLNDHDDDTGTVGSGNGYLVIAVITGYRASSPLQDETGFLSATRTTTEPGASWYVFAQITDMSP